MTTPYENAETFHEATAGTSVPGASANARPADAPADDQSLGSIVSRISNNLSTLVRQELDLAKIELKDEGKKAGKAAGMFGGAAFAGWMAALFLSLTLMWALDNIMDVTWAALIVFVLWAIAAAFLASNGRKEMKAINPTPEQTVETLKEDAQWLKAQKK